MRHDEREADREGDAAEDPDPPADAVEARRVEELLLGRGVPSSSITPSVDSCSGRNSTSTSGTEPVYSTVAT